MRLAHGLRHLLGFSSHSTVPAADRMTPILEVNGRLRGSLDSYQFGSLCLPYPYQAVEIKKQTSSPNWCVTSMHPTSTAVTTDIWHQHGRSRLFGG